MINKIILVGRLGQQPDIKDNYAILNIATTYRWFDKNKNQWVSETEWHRCSIFGQRIDFCKRLVKGGLVYIEGRLKTSHYEKDGQQRQSTTVIVDKINSLSKLSDSGEAQGNDEASIDRPFEDIKDDLKNNSHVFFDSDNIPF